MQHKKSDKQVIGIREETDLDFRPNPLPLFPLRQLQSSQVSPYKPHLTIQIPTSSPAPAAISAQNHEIFFDSHNSLISTPHKRSLMTQNSSKSPVIKNSGDNRRKDSTFTNPFSFSGHFSVPIDPQQIADTLIRHLSGARLICFQLRFIFLFSLGSIYFLVSNPGKFFILNFIFLLAFSLSLLISLNLGLPSLPYIRFPAKFISFSSKPPPQKPVIWSIGSSKPKSERNELSVSGSSVQIYSNGDIYEGEFHKGKYSGSGVYYYYMKGRYEGDWIDQKYDGYGVETWARGSRYRGQYRQGLRHGVGVYRFYTGDVYAGEWSNGQCHGCGVHTCGDGSKYVGEFKWGVKHGLGYYHFRNGDVYAGEYFADKIHGYGVYQFGNGHRYEGAWHEGRRQGLGMYTRNGKTQCGHWQNGVFYLPSSQNQNVELNPVYSSDSKVTSAVQEARGAAERAYEAAKIDDRVSKAIAAANKAANAARVASVKAVQNQMRHNK